MQTDAIYIKVAILLVKATSIIISVIGRQELAWVRLGIV